MNSIRRTIPLIVIFLLFFNIFSWGYGEQGYKRIYYYRHPHIKFTPDKYPLKGFYPVERNKQGLYSKKTLDNRVEQIFLEVKLSINYKLKKAKLELIRDNKTFTAYYDLTKSYQRDYLTKTLKRFDAKISLRGVKDSCKTCSEITFQISDLMGARKSQVLASDISKILKKIADKVELKQQDYVHLKKIKGPRGKEYNFKVLVDNKGNISGIKISTEDGSNINLRVEKHSDQIIIRDANRHTIAFRIKAKKKKDGKTELSIDVVERVALPLKFHTHIIQLSKDNRRKWKVDSTVKIDGKSTLTLDHTVAKDPDFFESAVGTAGTVLEAVFVGAIWNLWKPTDKSKKQYIIEYAKAEVKKKKLVKYLEEDMKRVADKLRSGKENLNRVASKLGHKDPPRWIPFTDKLAYKIEGTRIFAKAILKNVACSKLPKKMDKWIQEHQAELKRKDLKPLAPPQIEQLKILLRAFRICRDETIDFPVKNQTKQNLLKRCDSNLLVALESLKHFNLGPKQRRVILSEATKDFEFCEKVLKDDILHDLDKCLAKVKTDDQLALCTYELQRAAPYYVGQVTLKHRLVDVFKDRKDVQDKQKIYDLAQEHFKKCAQEKYFIPFDKNYDLTKKEKLAHAIKKNKTLEFPKGETIIKGCVFSSILVAADNAAPEMIRFNIKKYVKKAPWEKNHEYLYAQNRISSRSMNIAHQCFERSNLYKKRNVFQNFDYDRLSSLTPERFKEKVFKCIHEITLGTGALIAKRKIATRPEVQIIAYKKGGKGLSKKEFDRVLNDIVNKAYWPCAVLLPRGTKPDKCQFHIEKVATAIVTKEAIKLKMKEKILEMAGSTKIFHDKIKKPLTKCLNNIERDFNYKNIIYNAIIKQRQAIERWKKTRTPTKKPLNVEKEMIEKQFRSVGIEQAKCLKDAVENVAYHTSAIVLKKATQEEDLKEFKIKISRSLEKEVKEKARSCFKKELKSIKNDVKKIQMHLKDVQTKCTLSLYKLVIPRIIDPILDEKMSEFISDKKLRKKRVAALKKKLVKLVKKAGSVEEIKNILEVFKATGTLDTIPTLIGINIDKFIKPKGKTAKDNERIKKKVIPAVLKKFKAEIKWAYKTKKEHIINRTLLDVQKFATAMITEEMALMMTRDFFKTTKDPRFFTKKEKKQYDQDQKKHAELGKYAKTLMEDCLKTIKPPPPIDKKLSKEEQNKAKEKAKQEFKKALNKCIEYVKVETGYSAIHYLTAKNLKEQLPGQKKLQQKLLDEMVNSKLKEQLRKQKTAKDQAQFLDIFQANAAERIAPYVLDTELNKQFKKKEDDNFKKTTKKAALEDLKECLKKTRSAIQSHYAKYSDKDEEIEKYPTLDKIKGCIHGTMKRTAIKVLKYVAAKQMGLISLYPKRKKQLINSIELHYNACLRKSQNIDGCVAFTIMHFSRQLSFITLYKLSPLFAENKRKAFLSSQSEAYIDCLKNIMKDMKELFIKKAQQIKAKKPFNKKLYNKLNVVIDDIDSINVRYFKPDIYQKTIEGLALHEKLSASWMQTKIMKCADKLKTQLTQLMKKRFTEVKNAGETSKRILGDLFDAVIPLMEVKIVDTKSPKKKKSDKKEKTDPIKEIKKYVTLVQQFAFKAIDYNLKRRAGLKNRLANLKAKGDNASKAGRSKKEIDAEIKRIEAFLAKNPPLEIEKDIVDLKIKLYTFLTGENEKKIADLIKNNDTVALQLLLKKNASKKVELQDLTDILFKSNLVKTVIKTQVAEMMKKELKKALEEQGIQNPTTINAMTSPRTLDRIFATKSGKKAMKLMIEKILKPMLTGTGQTSDKKKKGKGKGVGLEIELPKDVKEAMALAITNDRQNGGVIERLSYEFVQDNLNKAIDGSNKKDGFFKRSIGKLKSKIKQGYLRWKGSGRGLTKNPEDSPYLWKNLRTTKSGKQLIDYMAQTTRDKFTGKKVNMKEAETIMLSFLIEAMKEWRQKLKKKGKK